MSDGQSPLGRNGRVTLSGVEALLRLLLVRRALDRDAGLDSATLISGYPGSPLGGVDLMLDAQRELLEAQRVLHRPGVNEELALAAVWGSQMGAVIPYTGVDGVVGAWYGKTPGLDRSGDVLRHANAMGSGPNGGAVLFCGDDPGAKSSTLNCDSQYTYQDACVPVLYPGNQEELVALGVHAFELSRRAGPLVGLKVVTAVADGSGGVTLDHAHYAPRPLRELLVDGKPWRHEPLAMIGPHRVAEQELLTVHYRLAAARAYVRQQGLDRTYGAGGAARLGVITAGKTYFDVVQAFHDLGVTQAQLSARGVRVLKLAMTYPLVEETVLEFARSVEALAVIEEKRPFIETQLRAILHEAGSGVPVTGKRDRAGLPLVSAVGELDATQIASVLRRLLPELRDRSLAIIGNGPAIKPPLRPPEYCSGCPHNRSTLVPPGALVGGGVGCHGIMYFEPRQRELPKLPPPPMGAEGVPWIGLAPFVAERHLFQNIGDGTLSHSGILAIRASVAAGVNVTFKILYNAAVAMTGGQEVTGLLDVPALARELHAERVARIVVCADHPEHYDPRAHWPPGVQIYQRERLPQVQAELRELSGVTAIIFDQRCASEARRLRRRGLLPTPQARVIINEAICEGCGDCRSKSNCASVLPTPTEFGEKRRIDDSSCNRDYTCLEGDCPSFVTITPKRQARAQGTRAAKLALPQGELPQPQPASFDEHYAVYFTGIGGTGVVTAGRIMTAAAEAAGFRVSSLDQTGLAQRGGAVVSHIHFARMAAPLGAAAIGPAAADLYLSSDIFQAASPTHLARVHSGRSFAAVDRSITPTSTMQQLGEAAPDVAALQQVIAAQLGEGRALFIDAQRIAERVFSQHVLANVVLLGAAFQRGGLPLTLADMEAGLARRGPGAANREAFEWGRWAAHDPGAVEAALAAGSGATGRSSPFDPSARALARAAQLLAAMPSIPDAIRTLLQRRTAQVIDYHNVRLARRYLQLVQDTLERDSADNDWQLTRALSQSWFRLLTYKDEYEVARLHSNTRYDRMARELGIEGPYTITYHLHPPFLRRLGLMHKLPLGWVYALLFILLRRLSWLRGTALDVFGWDRDRRMERALIEEYRAHMQSALADERLPYARKVELAGSALAIKGYGTIKESAAEAWRERAAQLLRPSPQPPPAAAPSADGASG